MLCSEQIDNWDKTGEDMGKMKELYQEYSEDCDDIMQAEYVLGAFSTRMEFIENVYAKCNMAGIPSTMMHYVDSQIKEMMDYE